MPYIGNITQDFNVSNAMLDTDSVTSIKIVDGTIEGADIAANLDLSDTQKIRLGAGNDLQIYHDGSHSRIVDAGTGGLKIQSNALAIDNAAGTETMAAFTEDSSVQLRFNNSTKFETTSTGVQVDGGLTVSSDYPTINLFDTNNNDFRIQNRNGVLSFVDVDNSDVVRFAIDSGNAKNSMAGTLAVGTLELADNAKAKFGTGDDLQIFHDGTNSYLQNLTNNFRIESDALRLRSYTGGENFIVANVNGAVELYYDAVKQCEISRG